MSSSSSSSPEITTASVVQPEGFSYKDATDEEVLEDLLSRFIYNLPDEEFASVERICFQIEQAHWFYEDFIREVNPKFPSLPLKRFSAMLFNSCPLLQRFADNHEEAFNTFLKYKTRVPVCGAIMLNDNLDKCVLVKGWKSSSGWGFPKGKINEDEPPATCAIREVLEETGYNIGGQLDPQNVIEMTVREQRITLFIVSGVPEDFAFQTKTRKEISKIEWFKLSDLPTWKRNKAAPGKFYLITPFIAPLRVFINDRKRHTRKGRKNNQNLVLPNKGRSRKEQSSRAPPIQVNPELSSQSSSADNGDPQTPSPQYRASTSPTISTANNSQQTGDLDPHFARLLASLAMSGQKEEEKILARSPKHLSSDVRPARRQPSPTTVGRRPPTVDLSRRHEIDRNAKVDQTTTNIPESSLNLSTASDRTVTSSSPHRLEHGVDMKFDSTSDPPRPASGSDVLHSTRLQKQLSLLESVADESARMSPLLAIKQVPPHPGATDYPIPPSSVPPMDMGVIYASQPLHPTHTQLLPDIHRRPQTSHNTHRSIYPGPSSMSMNQSQLLALMRQPRAPEPLAPFPGPPAHFHLPHGPHHSFASPYGPSNSALMSTIPPPVPLSASSVQPGSSFNIRPQPLPISPVGHLPVRNVTVNPRDASALLSILNGTGPMGEPGRI